MPTSSLSVVQQIKGQVGLLFTDTEPQEVIEWFKDFHQPDFARSGNRASRTVILPAGPVMQHHSDPPESFPHNEEPQLRKLLKLIGEKMVEFRVGLRARWDSTTGEVEEVTDPGVRLEVGVDADADGEEAELGAEDDEEAIRE